MNQPIMDERALRILNQPLYKRLDWTNTLFLVITPLVVLIWTPFHVYFNGLEWGVLAFFFLYSIITSLAITGGYHRLFAHRSYNTPTWVKAAYLIFGAAAFQGSALKWCSAHRDHHRYVDTEQDPYTITRGFWWAHIGWVFFKENPTAPLVFSPDLLKDRLIYLQHKYYFPIAAFMGFGVPTLIGWSMGSPLGGLLFGGFVRSVMTQHCTFFINSLCHMWGKQTYTNKVTARDNFVLAFFTYGEGYHNFHHKFQADYRNGIKWYHWDPTKWLIRGMAAMKWAHGLKKVSPEEILRAELSHQEHMLLNAGIPADKISPFRQRVEEAQRRFQILKADYRKFKQNLREQNAHFYEQARIRMEQIRVDMRQAKREFKKTRAQWIHHTRQLRRSPSIA